MSQSTCETCEHYEPGTGGHGRCKATQPTDDSTAYPTDWCNFHKPSQNATQEKSDGRNGPNQR